jgi:hypothetical protein
MKRHYPNRVQHFPIQSGPDWCRVSPGRQRPWLEHARRRTGAKPIELIRELVPRAQASDCSTIRATGAKFIANPLSNG